MSTFQETALTKGGQHYARILYLGGSLIGMSWRHRQYWWYGLAHPYPSGEEGPFSLPMAITGWVEGEGGTYDIFYKYIV
jgi:hypothetical protein